MYSSLFFSDLSLKVKDKISLRRHDADGFPLIVCSQRSRTLRLSAHGLGH